MTVYYSVARASSKIAYGIGIACSYSSSMAQTCYITCNMGWCYIIWCLKLGCTVRVVAWALWCYNAVVVLELPGHYRTSDSCFLVSTYGTMVILPTVGCPSVAGCSSFFRREVSYIILALGSAAAPSEQGGQFQVYFESVAENVCVGIPIHP